MGRRLDPTISFLTWFYFPNRVSLDSQIQVFFRFCYFELLVTDESADFSSLTKTLKRCVALRKAKRMPRKCCKIRTRDYSQFSFTSKSYDFLIFASCPRGWFIRTKINAIKHDFPSPRFAWPSKRPVFNKFTSLSVPNASYNALRQWPFPQRFFLVRFRLSCSIIESFVLRGKKNTHTFTPWHELTCAFRVRPILLSSRKAESENQSIRRSLEEKKKK